MRPCEPLAACQNGTSVAISMRRPQNEFSESAGSAAAIRKSEAMQGLKRSATSSERTAQVQKKLWSTQSQHRPPCDQFEDVDPPFPSFCDSGAVETKKRCDARTLDISYRYEGPSGLSRAVTDLPPVAAHFISWLGCAAVRSTEGNLEVDDEVSTGRKSSLLSTRTNHRSVTASPRGHAANSARLRLALHGCCLTEWRPPSAARHARLGFPAVVKKIGCVRTVLKRERTRWR